MTRRETQYADDDARWSALMASSQQGAEHDYRQLLGELGAVAENYLRSRFGPRDFIEDVVQEVLISVHQARHTYEPQRAFRPWFFAIVRHRAVDYLRRHRGRPDADIASVEDEPAPTIDLDRHITGGRLLEALTPQYREALTLTRIVGLTNAEAANHLCISEGAVKVRVHRALSRLRNLMEAGE